MATTSNSFYWYDLETTGLRKSWDRFVQFAGQRTDLALNPIGEPLITYVRLPPEVLPDADSALLTGITPQKVQKNGISEWEAIRQIHREFSKPGTCIVGYNNIAFDDEFIRFALFRNLLPPYTHTYKNGNSRFDLYTVVKTMVLVGQEHLDWPRDKKNRITTKLADLAQANGIDPTGAHDAYTDVKMSIALARLIKERKPDLWDGLYNSRSKQSVESILDSDCEFFVHVSSFYGAKRHFGAPVRVIADHPDMNTRVIVADLSADLSMLKTASPQELNDARYLSKKDAEASGRMRLEVNEVATNQCPVFMRANKLNKTQAKRLNVDLHVLNRNLKLLDELKNSDLEARIHKMLRIPRDYSGSADEIDVSERLYERFIDGKDERLCEAIHRAIDHGQPWPKDAFVDHRLPNLANRLRFELRPNDEPRLAEKHRKHVKDMLNRKDVGIPNRRKVIKAARKGKLTDKEARIVDKVESYIDDIAKQYDV